MCRKRLSNHKFKYQNYTYELCYRGRWYAMVYNPDGEYIGRTKDVRADIFEVYRDAENKIRKHKKNEARRK